MSKEQEYTIQVNHFDASEKDQVLIEANDLSSNNSHGDDGYHAEKVIERKEADVTLQLLEQYEEEAGELTPEIERRLKWKLWLTIVPMVSFVNFVLFLDKNAMGYANLLGMFEDLHLNQARYNNLQTFLYVGYLLGQIPSHLLFQRIRLSWYITGVTSIWALLTLLQLACKNYSHVAAIRFFLGFFESGVTPAIEHTIAMWFTPAEQAVVNPIFWISCLANGIPGGITSWLLIHFVHTISPWRAYWAAIGGLTVVLSITAFFFYPDNPATYRWFTPIERVHVIKRIKKATNSSIEQKIFKKEQAIEALKDPVTWLFGFFVFALMFANNISFQSAIIYKNLGLSNLQSTLVAVASSGWSMTLAIAFTILLSKFKEQTAHIATLFCLISLFGGILVVSLPLHLSKGYGILAGIFLTNASGNSFIAAFSWSQSSSAGYTKRLIRTIVWSICYSVINLFASQFWLAKDKPRYYRAWILIIVFAWTIGPITLQVIRYILAKRNKERRQYIQDIADGKIEDEYGTVTSTDAEGHTVQKKVDVSMLDLTDLQNKKFIYPL